MKRMFFYSSFKPAFHLWLECDHFCFNMSVLYLLNVNGQLNSVLTWLSSVGPYIFEVAGTNVQSYREGPCATILRLFDCLNYAVKIVKCSFIYLFLYFPTYSVFYTFLSSHSDCVTTTKLYLTLSFHFSLLCHNMHIKSSLYFNN